MCCEIYLYVHMHAQDHDVKCISSCEFCVSHSDHPGLALQWGMCRVPLIPSPWWSASRASAFSKPRPTSPLREPTAVPWTSLEMGPPPLSPRLDRCSSAPQGRGLRLPSRVFTLGLSVDVHVFPFWVLGWCHLSFFLQVIKSNLISSFLTKILLPGLGPTILPLALGTLERDSDWQGLWWGSPGGGWWYKKTPSQGIVLIFMLFAAWMHDMKTHLELPGDRCSWRGERGQSQGSGRDQLREEDTPSWSGMLTTDWWWR